mgnify:CR=1 FL=1
MIGLLATLVLIVVRVVFVVPVIASLKRSQRKGRERVHDLEHAMQRLEERDFGDDRRKGNAERFIKRYAGMVEEAAGQDREGFLMAALLSSDAGRAYLLLDAASGDLG